MRGVITGVWSRSRTERICYLIGAVLIGAGLFHLVVFAVDGVVEVGGITLQAWRHVPSHLNRETPFNSAVSTVLAAGGGVRHPGLLPDGSMRTRKP